MNQLESRIRDYLANHLTLLGSGLTLVETEYELESEVGAGGFIDILARDGFGHFVVIELKRSDQTARAAIHELMKYCALLRAGQGLRSDQVRAVLASTHWHELAVPFCEYLKISDVHTEGFALVAEDAGVVTSAVAYNCNESARPLMVSRCQDVFLFVDAAERTRNLSRVADAARRAGLVDLFLLSLDYLGGNGQVVYPHAIYLVFSSPFQTMTDAEIRTMKRKMSWDRELDEPDENFLVWFREKLGVMSCSSEIATPEKLATMIAGGWQASVAHRSGRYSANHGLLSDQDLLVEAVRQEGGAAYYLTRTASPKYRPGWMTLKQSLPQVLLGDDHWTDIVPRILAEIAKDRPAATVSVHIYNPTRIVLSLVKLFRSGDTRYLPALQVVVEDGEDVFVYRGELAWDGEAVRMFGEEWLRTAFGSVEEFFLKQHFGVVHEDEVAARELLGLTSFVVEVRRVGKQDQRLSVLESRKGRLIRNSPPELPPRSMIEFAAENTAFGHSLIQAVASVSVGFVD